MAFYEPLARADAQGELSPSKSADIAFSNVLFNALRTQIAHGVSPALQTHTGNTAGSPDAIFAGQLLDSEIYDLYPVSLKGGTTYAFDERGSGANPLIDPYLLLYDPVTDQFVAQDDDGGFDHSSLLSFTPAASGTYYVVTSSWFDLFTPFHDPGADYRVDMWIAKATADVGDTIKTAGKIGLGTTYGSLEAAGDTDMYAISLTAGILYSFDYAGGVANADDFDGQPGENISFLRMYDSGGNLVELNVNYKTFLTYAPTQSGTYYLSVDPVDPAMTGGYTIDVSSQSLAGLDPLDTIYWRSANNVPFIDTDSDGVGDTAYVYFAPAGENFGEKADDGVTLMTTYGWTDWQIAGVMSALEQYSHILGTHYVITDDVNQATFRLLTTTSDLFGAYAYPQDPVFGTQQGILVFAEDYAGFGDDPASLSPGGLAYEEVLHEFGHSHGLAHPQDDGGGSEIMPGVRNYFDFGAFDLNQGIYTVMSYNFGWEGDPDGYPLTFDYSFQATLSALDIAVLQQRYGVHAYNTGDNIYTLPDVNADGTSYQTIWDTGGTDALVYSGSRDARIDLTAATLDYSPTGAGVVSYAQGIFGGYTIANGVVIENAAGSSGNDVLIGNDADNVLTGNAGDDTLLGRGGDDNLIGGDGFDIISLGAGNDVFVDQLGARMSTKLGSMSVDVITDLNGSDDLIDLSAFGMAFDFHGTGNNSHAGDLTYKVYGSVTGAENALGIDIDGHPDAGGVSGPVTVMFGNIDGGKPDFAIILLNTSSVATDEFIFA